MTLEFSSYQIVDRLSRIVWRTHHRVSFSMRWSSNLSLTDTTLCGLKKEHYHPGDVNALHFASILMCSQYKVSPPKRRLKSLSLPISSPVVTCSAYFALRGSVASSIYLSKAFKVTKSQSSCLTLNCFRDVACFITKEPDMLRLNLTNYLLYVTPISPCL